MTEPIEVRSQILDSLRRELVGPDPRPEHQSFNNGEEILRPQDPPRHRYSSGVLFPGGTRLEQIEVADEEEIGDESGPPEGDEPEDDTTTGCGAGDSDSTTEHEVNRANEFLPSAMGVTALVRCHGYLTITVHAGRYEKKAVEGLGKQDKEGKWQPHHWRIPVAPPPLKIDCDLLASTRPIMKEFPLDTGSQGMKLCLHIYSRPYVRAEDHKHDRIVTFTLTHV
ncbi:MAG: hypothetical protein WCN95_16675 [bacterium]